jgi:phenylpropionate dioxygenase-like ring-hydroxylating dioxygenase large terminal subunit
MDGGVVAGVPGLTPRVASSALALVTAAVEERHRFVWLWPGDPALADPALIANNFSGQPQVRIDSLEMVARRIKQIEQQRGPKKSSAAAN